MSQRKTFYIHFDTYTLNQGPSLVQARSRHGCTAFENHGKTIVLVAGGWNPNMNTVEYLDLSNDNPSTWLLGPALPSKMDDLVLINTNVGVLLIGGFDSTTNYYSDLIQQLVCNTDEIENCVWQIFGQTLAMRQSSPVVIPIPSSLNLCQYAISTTPPPIEPPTTLAPVLGTVVSSQEDCSYCTECARPDYGHIGGSASSAEIEKWPWIVSIGWENGSHWETYCTGSIISRNVIVTANHCFFSKNKVKTVKQLEIRRKTKVRLGDQKLNDDSNELDMARTYEINTVIGHPNYGGGSRVKFDLALIFTKEPIQFNDRTKPICLPNQAYNSTDKYANQNAKIAGFGIFDGTSIPSDDLRAADFKVLSKNDCISQSLYRPRFSASQHFFCAGNPVSFAINYCLNHKPV